MLSFLLSLLFLLLYAAIIILVLWGLSFLFQMVFNRPVPPRVQQLVLAILGILMLIWLVQSLVTHTPIPAPWAIR